MDRRETGGEIDRQRDGQMGGEIDNREMDR